MICNATLGFVDHLQSMLHFFFLFIQFFKVVNTGNSLVVKWLGLCAFTAKGLGSIPGRGTKIPQATRRNLKRKKKCKNDPWLVSLCKDHKLWAGFGPWVVVH